jgi:hypothetical protein
LPAAGNSTPERFGSLDVEWIRFYVNFLSDPDGMGKEDSIGQAGFTGLIG